MRAVRMVAWMVLVGLAASVAAAQEVQTKAEAPPAVKPEPKPPVYLGGPFMRLKGLSYEQRVQLAAFWAETAQKVAAADEAGKKALADYQSKGEALLNNTQKSALAAAVAEREARMKALREQKPAEKPAETPKPRAALRLRGAVAELDDLTDEQVEKINALAVAREAARKAAMDEMQAKSAAADTAFETGLAEVLKPQQRAALKGAEEKARADRAAADAKVKVDREAAAKKAAEERAKRTFGGDFRLVRDLSDEQQVSLGGLWVQAQEAAAAAKKAADAANADYLTKGKALLTPEQLKALDELTKPRTPAPKTAE